MITCVNEIDYTSPLNIQQTRNEFNMRSLTFLIFAILTICCWGVYGPVLHVGQEKMGEPGKLSSLKPFIGVGVAYFLIAVLFPLFVLFTREEKGSWSASGIFWSFFAGTVGAVGALGIILAFKFQGKPFYVMPLVFGCAPVINTVVSMLMARTIKNASLMFYVAVLIVAVGAAGVLTFKPTAKKPVGQPATSVSEAPDKTTGSGENESTVVTDETGESSSEPKPNVGLIAAFIAMTALCWGAYGPVLHKGQARMGGSRLRPFLCVGLAYFAIAVVVPYFLLGSFPEGESWDLAGFGWSMLAGAAGAVGALGIIYAFNFGGKPVYVMPLVFGLAPVVNTFTETISKGLFDQVSNEFWASLVMVIIGAVMVLLCAPRGKKPVPSADSATK